MVTGKTSFWWCLSSALYTHFYNHSIISISDRMGVTSLLYVKILIFTRQSKHYDRTYCRKSKQQYALCIIRQMTYGCNLLKGWVVCGDCSLIIYHKSTVLLVVHCRWYLGTCQISPTFPYTNIINFFYFRNLIRNQGLWFDMY